MLGQTDQGIKNLLPEEAARQEGADPDYAQRDLYNAIENGNFPSWSMYIQVMTYDEAEKWQFNPFDLTKVSAGLYSAHEVLMSIDYSCTYSHIAIGICLCNCIFYGVCVAAVGRCGRTRTTRSSPSVASRSTATRPTTTSRSSSLPSHRQTSSRVCVVLCALSLDNHN